MIFLDNQEIFDPAINLAIEEYALEQLLLTEDYLLFYINQPSIIIGRNQNTIEEINPTYVKEQGIQVVRRLSGGGAVYHDLGNLNFSFITKDDGNSFHNFRKFTYPVVKALQNLGVPAELSGRNDILVKGRKISGNAQYASKGRMFSHGTLMFNSEIEHVVSALRVNQDKLVSKGIKSIRSRVANISEFLPEKYQTMTIELFRKYLLQQIFATEFEKIHNYQWLEEDWKKIYQIAKERYQNWDWNYGKSPKCNLQKSARFSIGQIDVRLSIEKGKIASCKIYGDFFGIRPVVELEQILIGLRYDNQTLKETIEKVDLTNFFGDISHNSFTNLIVS